MTRLLAAVTLTLCLQGCFGWRDQASDESTAEPTRHPAAESSLEVHAPDGNTSGPITLARLLQLAGSNNPELAEARAEIEAAGGRRLQASLYPNPSLNVQ